MTGSMRYSNGKRSPKRRRASRGGRRSSRLSPQQANRGKFIRAVKLVKKLRRESPRRSLQAIRREAFAQVYGLRSRR